jgi:catechol 2,3-dioxygenase-like lactoylglutathione lyase family enzyme
MESMVVFYACDDLAETTAFYEELLGLSRWLDQPGCRIFDSGYGYLGFVEREREAEAYQCISFNYPNQEAVDAQYERLKDLLDCTLPQLHNRFPVYSFFVKDPNGYTVEFQKIVKE